MVRLIPPPAGVQDRAVYDYLYQLQEYLGVELDRLATAAATARTETTTAVSANNTDWVNALWSANGDLNVKGLLLQKGLRAVKAEEQENSPKWGYLLAGEYFTVATIVLKNRAYTVDGIYNDSGVTYSPKMRISLPFPIQKAVLLGNGKGDNGISVGNVELDGNVGAIFRLLSPKNEATTTTLRLLAAGEIATPPDNPPANYGNSADDLPDAENPAKIAATYVGKTLPSGASRWKYGQNWLRTGNSGAAGKVNDSNKKGLIECDTFVSLILRGLPYADSPYGLEGIGEDGNGHVLENTTFDDAHYPANQNGLAWVTELNKKLIGKDTPLTIVNNGDGTVTDGTTLQPDANSPAALYFGGNMVFAHQLAWAMWQMGAVFGDAAQVRTGDIAFWSDHKDSRRYFGGVTHVALVSVEDDVTYLYEATSKATEVVRKIPLADKTPQPTYFARIDYGT